MSKCMYCNKGIETLYPVVAGKDKAQFTCCCDDCVKKSVDFYNFIDCHKRHFIIGLIIFMAVFFSGVINLSAKNMMPGSILLGSGFALFGLDVLVFPFATPETFSIFGIKKTIVITRILGACIILLGIWLCYILWNS